MQLTVKKVLPDRSNVKGQKFMKNSNETFGVISNSMNLENKKESRCFDSFTLFDVSTVKQRIERLPR